jgi:SAM-dependent methyltransferase
MHSHSKSDHVGTENTVRLVTSNGGNAKTVLDVGCGDGAIAKVLLERGYQVSAIDLSEEAVAKAQAAGVPAKVANLLEFSGDQFDLILMSRSLHHIHPVESAVAKIGSLLKPGGILVVDEFAPELMDLRTALWIYGLKSVLQAEAHHTGHGLHLENGSIPADPIAHWREHHFGKHHVTESGELLRALKGRFKISSEERGPYLYRYLMDDVDYEQGRRLAEWETRLCLAGLITPIGLSIVAAAG